MSAPTTGGEADSIPSCAPPPDADGFRGEEHPETGVKERKETLSPARLRPSVDDDDDDEHRKKTERLCALLEKGIGSVPPPFLALSP